MSNGHYSTGLGELKKNFSQLQEEFSKLQLSVKNYLEPVSKLKVSVENCVQTISTLQQSLDLKASTKMVENRLNKLDNSISLLPLNTDIGKLQSTLNGIRADLAKLEALATKEDLQTLQNSVATKATQEDLCEFERRVALKAGQIEQVLEDIKKSTDASNRKLQYGMIAIAAAIVFLGTRI